MKPGVLFNYIRRQRRLYRALMLVVDQFPLLRAALRGVVNRLTVPTPDRDLDDPHLLAREQGDVSLPPTLTPESGNGRFFLYGYPGLLDKSCALEAGRSMLLVDVSSIVRFNPQTGIQRVVCRLLEEMVHWEAMPFRVEPVYEYRGRYYFARRFTHGLLGVGLDQADREWRPDSLVRPASGDVFLGLDWAQPMIRSAEATLSMWKRSGVSLHFVVYDLLPIHLPQYFPRRFSLETIDWVRRIAGLADSLQCISESVVLELQAYLENHRTPSTGPDVASFPLGADFRLSGDSSPRKDRTTSCDDQYALTCLMVGTLDPRKGYAQALAAFELLWKKRLPLRLLIVGRPGAMNARLSLRLRQHPEAKGSSPNLCWLESASDEQLYWCYRNADFLLAASEGEGFGLPLIEAAAHGLPVLARNLPVFREVLGDQARYFEGLGPEPLADALQRFADDIRGGYISAPIIPETCSWRQSAQALLGNLLAVEDRQTLTEGRGRASP